MADLQTKYNDLIDTFIAMARITELGDTGIDMNELLSRLTQAIRTNLPDKADDLSEGSARPSSDGEDVGENDGAYSLAALAKLTADTALEEARMPMIVPDGVLYGKAAADYSTGNSVSIVPCQPDGTAFSPTPSAISVWITFPTDNTQTGYDIEEDDVLAYLAIPSLGGKVGVLLPVASSLVLPVGTAVGDMLVWNNTTLVWEIKPWIKSVADMQINGTTFKVQVKYTKADGTIDATWTDIHTGTDCDSA